MREGIRRQHVGPQVAVVPCRIAAREDVAERVRETTPGWPPNNRDLLLSRPGFKDFRLLRAELGVQAEVEQAELQLAQDKHRRR